MAAFRDDKAAIEDVYEHVSGANAIPATWEDENTSGPPSLQTPQDVLVFNAVATLFLKCIDGTATAQDVADLSANWPVFQAACVRPLGA